MKINIDELINVTVQLLNKIKHQKGEFIDLEVDYYWDISSEEIFDPYKDPKDITLGQLSDDLDEIKRLELSIDKAIPYDLKRIGVVLHAISKKVETIT